MEGPSLKIAAEQLSPLVGQTIQKVAGNTKIEKERFKGQRILSLFSYGKYLIFQFKNFALRIHFLLFGNFQATGTYQIYRQRKCKVCGTKALRKKTGARNRVSFICTHCQK